MRENDSVILFAKCWGLKKTLHFDSSSQVSQSAGDEPCLLAIYQACERLGVAGPAGAGAKSIELLSTVSDTCGVE